MGYLFLLCLLLPVYTITGYDASAHTSEETKNAAHSVPRGIVSAVFWSSLVGWVMICAITLAIPDLATAAAQGWGMFFATMDAILPRAEAALYFFILIAQLLCGLATVTSASRMLFAFSRDDGVPGFSKALASVSPKYRTPVNAIWTATVLCILYVVLAMIDQGRRNLDLRDRGELDPGLPVPVVHHSAGGRRLAYGGPKWPTPGPWAMSTGVYKLVTLLSVVGMG
jgi:amino acid transporter